LLGKGFRSCNYPQKGYQQTKFGYQNSPQDESQSKHFNLILVIQGQNSSGW